MQSSFQDRCPVTVVVFDPTNEGRVTATLKASAGLYYDHVRDCYLVRFREHRIKVKFDAERGYHAELRLTIQNFRRLFQTLATEQKETK